MKKDNNEMENALALSEITTNTTIGLEDIITVFTSKYEDQLHTTMDTLRQTAKQLQEELQEAYDVIKDAFDTSTIEVSNKHFSVFASISGLDADGVNIDLSFEKERGSYHGSKHISIKHSKGDAKKLKDIYDRKDENAKAIKEVATKISNMNRKERQIRAKIVEKKIEASNMAGLLDSPELLALIEG